MTVTQALTRKELRELETELLTERARIERSLGSERDANGTAMPIDAATPVHADAEVKLELSVESRTHARYSAILEAQTRLASGTYGICVSCNNRIPYGRLIVMPEATRCIACGARA